MYRLAFGVTLLALVAVGIALVFPGDTTRAAAAVAATILFLQFPMYLCSITGETAHLSIGIGPLGTFTAPVPPPASSTDAPPAAPMSGGWVRPVLLALGLSLGLPAIALAAFLVARETGHVLAPIPFVFTPALAVVALFRLPGGPTAFFRCSGPRSGPPAGEPLAAPDRQRLD